MHEGDLGHLRSGAKTGQLQGSMHEEVIGHQKTARQRIILRHILLPDVLHDDILYHPILSSVIRLV